MLTPLTQGYLKSALGVANSRLLNEIWSPWALGSATQVESIVHLESHMRRLQKDAYAAK